MSVQDVPRYMCAVKRWKSNAELYRLLSDCFSSYWKAGCTRGYDKQDVGKQMKGGKKQYYQLLVSDKTRY